MNPTTPINYRYDPIPDCIPSISTTVRYTTSNGNEFKSNSNALAKIEVRSNDFCNGMESHLQMDITNNSGNGVYFDQYASAVLRQVRILIGGKEASNIEYYSQLVNMLVSTQGSQSFQNILQICGGGDNDTSDSLVGNNGSQSTNFLAAGATGTFCIPMLSGIFNNQRFFPCGVVSGGITIELYFQTNFFDVFNCDAGAVPTTSLFYTVSNCQFIAKMVTITEPNVYNAIMNRLKTTGLVIKADDWVAYSNNIPAGTGSISLPISDKSLALKNFFSIMTLPTGSGLVSTQQSYKFDVAEYYYRIGGIQYPVQPCRSSSNSADGLTRGSVVEPFIELQKCFNAGGLYNLKNTTFCDYNNFSNNSTGTAAYNRTVIGVAGVVDTWGCFAMAYDFENYAMSDHFSSLNIQQGNLSVSLNIKFADKSPAGAILNCISYAHRDVSYVISGDGSFTRVD